MTATQALLTLASGKRPDDAMVQTCRLWMAGQEYYGEEAIVAAFSDHTITPGGETEIIIGRATMALFTGDVALVADIQDDAVIRIWRLGPGAPQIGEPAISVPFDTDLSQARADIFFAASDHPDIDAVALDRLVAGGGALARQNRWHGGRLHRCRAFLIRAFSDGSDAAGLFALHLVGGDTVRSAGFSFAVVRVRGDGDAQVYRDIAGDAAATIRPWRPRVA